MAKQYICGVCGKLGHNARTCGRSPLSSPKEKKVVAKKEKKLPTVQADNGSRRECSYCHLTGHTTSTCLARANEHNELQTKYALLLGKVCNYLNLLGLTPGARLQEEFTITDEWSIQRDTAILSDGKWLSLEEIETLTVLKTAYDSEKASFPYNALPDINVKYTAGFLLTGVEKCLAGINPDVQLTVLLPVTFENTIFLGITPIVQQHQPRPAAEALVHFLVTKTAELVVTAKNHNWPYVYCCPSMLCYRIDGNRSDFRLTSTTKIVHSDSWTPRNITFDTSFCWKSEKIRRALNSEPRDKRYMRYNRRLVKSILRDLNYNLGVVVDPEF
jgi:hypothetical protein